MSHAETPPSPAASTDDNLEAHTAEVGRVTDPARPANRERRKVHGVIAVLLVVMVVEAVAHVRMTILNQQLWSELQLGERERIDVTRERIDAVAKRPPDETFTVTKPVGQEKYDVYRFWGLLKRRELYVHYGVEGIRSPQEAIEILTELPEGVREVQDGRP